MIPQEAKLFEIKSRLSSFINERNWHQFHTPKNLIISLSVEVAELMRLFLWKTDEKIISDLDEKEFDKNIKEEMADIFNNLLYLSMLMEVDLLTASLEKIEKNKLKYPIQQAEEFSKSKT
jgi:NTP pyrophosphatase (non-canonical NTP hydrolase)